MEDSQRSIDNVYLTAVDTGVPYSTVNANNDVNEYQPTHHIPIKQLSLRKIRGQIGRRLDGEQQMISNLAKSLSKKRAMDRQKESLDMIPKTRDMPHYKETTTTPGPEVYSIGAAKASEQLKTMGKDRRSTVDLSKMRGGRSSFIFEKNQHEYEQNYHHQVQIGDAKSWLNDRPELKLGKQLDRDSTSLWKVQYMHFNKIRDDKEKMRIKRNHEETLNQIKVDHFVKQYGSNIQLMPPDLRMHVKG